MNAARRLKLMSIYTAVLLAAVAAVNWSIDPLGIWGNGDRPDETLARELVPYAVALDRPETLLVGNSRIAWSMNVGASAGVLNAGLPGATLDEIGALVDRALENPALRRIVLGADAPLFRPGHSGLNDRYRALPRRLHLDPLVLVPETLLNERILDRSRRVFTQRWSAAAKDSPGETGLWSPDHIRAEIGELLDHPRTTSNPLRRQAHERMARGAYTGFGDSDERLATYAAIIERAEAHGVEVIVLLPVQGALELDAMEEEGVWSEVQALYRKLALIHPFRDASGYSFLAFEPRLFIDPLHVWPVVGQVLLRSLLGRGCAGCGDVAARIAELPVAVDADNVEARLAEREQRRALARAAAGDARRRARLGAPSASDG